MNKPETIIVIFGDCEMGWIDFEVGSAGKMVPLSASELADPFPDLIAWLESIARGVEECAFTLDDEKEEYVFRIKRNLARTDHRFTLTASHSGELQSCFVDPGQLVGAVYSALVAYTESDRYHPEEWQYDDLFDVLRDHHSLECDLETVVGALAGEGREEVEDFINEADVGCTRVRLDERFDAMTPPEKTDCLTELLARRWGGWGGCRLTGLRSAILEEYLFGSS